MLFNRYTLILPLLVAPAYAATVSLPATQDTFVTSADPSHNFGGAGALQVSAPGSAKGEMQTFMMFNTSSAINQFNSQFGAGNWVITSATLSLGTNFGTQGATPNNPIFNTINAGDFHIGWQQNDSWLEGTGNPGAGTNDGLTFCQILNYTSDSDTDLGTFHWSAPGNGVSSWSLPLAPSFISDIDAAGDVSLRFYAADNAVSYLFNSRTFVTAGNQPALILTAAAVPEPASLAFLTVGAAALLTRKRSRNEARP